MDPEEMRAELEIFVNEGLREGWRGWPLKGEARKGSPRSGRLNVTALRVWRGGRSNLVSPAGRLGLFAISA